MKPLLLAFCFTFSSLMVPASAGASLPMVDGVGSYTHSQVMRHRGDSEKRAAPSRAAASRTYRRSLMPEYNRRARKFGKTSADRWLEAKVRSHEQQLRSGKRRR